jgi:tetratricopeptide (TPR) repeat protein
MGAQAGAVQEGAGVERRDAAVRMIVRHYLVLAFLAASSGAQTLPASAAEPGAAAVQLDASEIIEQAEQAQSNGQYQEAGDAIELVLRTPQFAELDASRQRQALLIGALAAFGREDYLSAHEFMVLVTDFPDANAEDWLLRAASASALEFWPDAASSITTVARRWPDTIAAIDPSRITTAAFRANKDGNHRREQLELLNALFAANFTLQLGLQPDPLWQELILDALDRNDLARAREISKRVQNTETLVEMRIDRRFDVLVKAEPKVFDIKAALDYQRKLLAKQVADDPRSLDARVQYCYTLLEAGRFEEVLALSNEVIARVAAAPADVPAYDNTAERLEWMYSHKAVSLRAMGRWEEALAIMEKGLRNPEDGAINASQAINLGGYYVYYGMPQKGLDTLEGIDWAGSLSPFGRMQLQHVRYRAYLDLGNTQDADAALAYLREHRADAEGTWQEALVDAGDLDGAAALYISRLRDPDKRAAALGEAQDYKPLPRRAAHARTKARWEVLLKRKDVAAAIDAVGRREKIPLYSVH